MLSKREIQKKEISTLLSWIQGPKECFYLAPNLSWPIDPEIFSEHIFKREGNLIFHHQERPIGFANLYLQLEFMQLFIGNVIINPEVRGQGYGKSLMQEMMKLVQKKGQSRAYLSVFAENLPAVKLYQGFGFQDFATEKKKTPEGEFLILKHQHLPFGHVD